MGVSCAAVCTVLPGRSLSPPLEQLHDWWHSQHSPLKSTEAEQEAQVVNTNQA